MATYNIEPKKTDFPARLGGRLKFNREDWWFTFLMFGIWILVNHWIGKLGVPPVIGIWLGGIAYTKYGRVHKAITDEAKKGWWRVTRKGPEAEVKIWDASETHVLGRSEPISLTIHGIDDLGFLNDNGKDTIVIEGEGSDIPAQEIDGQFDSHLRMAEVIRKAAALVHRRGYNVGWGWHFRSRPLNMPDLHANLEHYLHPEVLEPSALTRPEPEWTESDKRFVAYGLNMQELYEVTEAHGRHITMAAVCTVQRQDFEKSIADNQAHRLPIVQLASTLPAELEACGVVDPRPLSPREMHGYFRGAWDVATILDYNEWRTQIDEEAENHPEGSDEEIEDAKNLAVLTSDLHLPQQSIVAGEDYLLVDGTYTTVLWLTDGQDSLYPHQLRELFYIGIPWYSVSLVGNTNSTKGEYAFLDRWIQLSRDIEDKAGMIHRGPKKIAQQENRIERQKKVYESRFSHDYNIFIAVHHVIRDGLENDVDVALQKISLTNFSADRVEGSIWQLPFALCATTAIDMNML